MEKQPKISYKYSCFTLQNCCHVTLTKIIMIIVDTKEKYNVKHFNI